MKWDTLGTGVARRVPLRGNYKRQEEEIRVAKEKKKKKAAAIKYRIVAVLEK